MNGERGTWKNANRGGEPKEKEKRKNEKKTLGKRCKGKKQSEPRSPRKKGFLGGIGNPPAILGEKHITREKARAKSLGGGGKKGDNLCEERKQK